MKIAVFLKEESIYSGHRVRIYPDSYCYPGQIKHYVSVYTSEPLIIEDIETAFLIKNFILSNNYFEESDDVEGVNREIYSQVKTEELVNLISHRLKQSIVPEECKEYSILNDTYYIAIEYFEYILTGKRCSIEDCFVIKHRFKLTQLYEDLNRYYNALGECSKKILSKTNLYIMARDEESNMKYSKEYKEHNKLYAELSKELFCEVSNMDSFLSKYLENNMEFFSKYKTDSLNILAKDFLILLYKLDMFHSFFILLRNWNFLKECYKKDVCDTIVSCDSHIVNEEWIRKVHLYIQELYNINIQMPISCINHMILSIQNAHMIVDKISCFLKDESDKIEIFSNSYNCFYKIFEENGQLRKSIENCSQFKVVMIAKDYKIKRKDYLHALKAKNKILTLFYINHGASDKYYYNKNYGDITKREDDCVYYDDWQQESDDFIRSMDEDFPGWGDA